jgi:hypothetical protein
LSWTALISRQQYSTGSAAAVVSRQGRRLQARQQQQEANSSSKLRGLQQSTRLAAAYSRLQGLQQTTAGYEAYSSTHQTKRPTSAEVRAEVRVFRSEERSRGGEINFSPPLTLSCCGVFCIINHLHHDIMMSLLLGRPRVHEIKSSPLVNHVLVRSRVRPFEPPGYQKLHGSEDGIRSYCWPYASQDPDVRPTSSTKIQLTASRPSQLA